MNTELEKWEVDTLKSTGLETAPATASYLPMHSGDGYGYGGGALVTIGDKTIVIGEGNYAMALAKEIANRWNSGL